MRPAVPIPRWMARCPPPSLITIFTSSTLLLRSSSLSRRHQSSTPPSPPLAHPLGTPCRPDLGLVGGAPCAAPSTESRSTPVPPTSYFPVASLHLRVLVRRIPSHLDPPVNAPRQRGHSHRLPLDPVSRGTNDADNFHCGNGHALTSLSFTLASYNYYENNTEKSQHQIFNKNVDN